MGFDGKKKEIAKFYRSVTYKNTYNGSIENAEGYPWFKALNPTTRTQVLKKRINMPSRITLEGEITLHNLEGLHEQLQSALQGSGDVILSCSGLLFLDTAAFQLLVSLKKSLGNRPLVFQKVPSAVIEMGELLGLNTFLKLGG
jgi:anti-anti-sigma regulatory factor